MAGARARADVDGQMAPAAPERPRPPAPVDASDGDLLRRLRTGDRAAFTSLVVRHGGALLRLALTFLRSRPAAEEVVQDTWLAALEQLDRFEGRAALRTWLFHIVANKARTRLAREGRSVPFSALGAPEDGAGPAVDPERFDARGTWKAPPEAWSEENPERLAQGVETRAALEQAIAALPDGQRAVITLRDVEGLEAEEICNLLGITVSNQRVLLHRARSKVRLALEEHMAGARRC
jgi:RNA polymerase sigma-70 factor (ECF subfamily)